ncbi:uncharacterized protein F5Z01DRAFT_671567 [Emericellopsis atlantica]|uniref:Uncharacterized protein n=1 Tax=Emericellopsis atlantica TaxID=2614577 RepID=A0A9P7ZSZ9_9HYPO|nr:uncharacterized protein F5Z01DRAFT_671567 [Emericellopsis atlantica]KAG9257120.1 hypothetical protein F5Z01DRAFT_671567 [Emericellopsis atlantica]
MNPRDMYGGDCSTTIDGFSNSADLSSDYAPPDLPKDPYCYPNDSWPIPNLDLGTWNAPQLTDATKPMTLAQPAPQAAWKTNGRCLTRSKPTDMTLSLPQQGLENDYRLAATTKAFTVYKNSPRTSADCSSKATALPAVYDEERQMYYVRIDNNLQSSPRKGDIAWISSLSAHSTATKARVEEQAGPARRSRKRRFSQSASGEDEDDKTKECIDYSRNAKKKRLSAADPARVYGKYQGPPPPWTIAQENGETCKIEYNKEGRIMPGTYLSANQIKGYIEQNPRKDITMWLQNFPAQCKQRTLGDVQCLWRECPSRNQKIRQGWHQIAFDEYPQETTSGERDPFRVAAHMHLWCFEQCFDPLPLFEAQVLKPDARVLEKEGRQPFSITRDYKMIVQEAIEPWRKTHAADGPTSLPRAHEQTLAYQLVQYHLENQITARSELREARNLKKQDKGAPARTIETHKGSLIVYCEKELSPSRNAQNPYPRTGDDALQTFPQEWLADPRGLINYHTDEFNLEYTDYEADAAIMADDPTKLFELGAWPETDANTTDANIHPSLRDDGDSFWDQGQVALPPVSLEPAPDGYAPAPPMYEPLTELCPPPLGLDDGSAALAADGLSVEEQVATFLAGATYGELGFAA